MKNERGLDFFVEFAFIAKMVRANNEEYDFGEKLEEALEGFEGCLRESLEKLIVPLREDDAKKILIEVVKDLQVYFLGNKEKGIKFAYYMENVIR
ncbi:MAG: hypothetical protein OEL89_05460, partial [Candidatus Peregrinibacteria bacterium]|nr:hypothetical protein [Candidatus Peregrinibacteria bacterium]